MFNKNTSLKLKLLLPMGIAMVVLSLSIGYIVYASMHDSLYYLVRTNSIPINLSILEQRINYNLNVVYFAFSLWTLIIIIVMYYVYKLVIFVPLSKITYAISQRAKGTPSSAEVIADDEIGNISKSYNTLVENITHSEQRLNTTLSSINEAVITTNMTGKIMNVNPSAKKLFERTHDEILGRNISELINQNVILNNVGTGTIETDGKKSNGAVFPIEVNINEVILEDEHLFVISVYDLSYRRQIEEQLKSSKERYELAVAGSNDGIWDWDLTNDKIYYSSRLRTLLGYDKIEFPNEYESLLKYLHPDDRDILEKAMQLHLKESAPYDCIYRLQTKHQGYRWFRGKGIALRNNDGSPSRMAGSISDIHELVIAKEQAISSSKAKSDFVATMSHEIRTPLNGISGIAQLLLNENFSSENKALIKELNDSAQDLQTLLSDILDFAKIEAGKLEIEQVTLDFEKICCDVCYKLLHMIDKKNIQLYLNYPPNVPRIFVSDPVRLTQLMQNLISNAIKFTNQGTITISVQFTDNRLHVLVTDTGIGISKDKLSSLFDAFTQAETSTTRKFGGTGLGLAICKHITNALNGSIAVDSSPGQGSKFSVQIPISSNIEFHNWSNFLNNQQILIIDDKTKDLTSLKQYFETIGGKVELSESFVSPIEPFVVLYNADFLKLSPERIENIFNNNKWKNTTLIIYSGKPDTFGENSYKDILACTIRYPLNLTELNGIIASIVSEHNVLPVLESQIKKYSLEAIRTLIVDDIHLNRKITAKMLNEYKADVDFAESGKEAVNKCLESKYDVILLDLLMPGMDGYETCAAIRKTSINKNTPIIAVTANAIKETREKCYHVGMNAFISKPFMYIDLIKIIYDTINSPTSNFEVIGPGILDLKFDQHKIDGVARIFRDRFSDIIHDFISASNKDFDEIINFDESNLSRKELKAKIHAAKAPFASFGINEIYKELHKMEQDCENMKFIDIREKIVKMHNLFNNTYLPMLLDSLNH